jgi:ribosomal protein S18 acetylase RimI-like enzyme
MTDASPAPAIRAATRADAAAMGVLGALLVKTHHDFDPQRFIATTPGTSAGYGSYLAGLIGKPEIVLLVAELGGAVAGYTYAGVEGTDYMALRGPAGALYDIIVNPAHRGQGIGRRLLDATLAELKARGAPRVLLSTAERNAAAQRLFERAGFRRTMIEMTHEL